MDCRVSATMFNFVGDEFVRSHVISQKTQLFQSVVR